jgi:hypothetical protein
VVLKIESCSRTSTARTSREELKYHCRGGPASKAINPLMLSNEGCSDLAEAFSVASINYFKNILFSDFLP